MPYPVFAHFLVSPQIQNNWQINHGDTKSSFRVVFPGNIFLIYFLYFPTEEFTECWGLLKGPLGLPNVKVSLGLSTCVPSKSVGHLDAMRTLPNPATSDGSAVFWDYRASFLFFLSRMRGRDPRPQGIRSVRQPHNYHSTAKAPACDYFHRLLLTPRTKKDNEDCGLRAHPRLWTHAWLGPRSTVTHGGNGKNPEMSHSHSCTL